MKIIHLFYHNGIGGQEKNVIRLCKALRGADGIEMSLGFCQHNNSLFQATRSEGIATVTMARMMVVTKTWTHSP